MGAIAVFSFTLWQARYPEFQEVPAATAQAYFYEAALYHDNSGSGPVRDVTQQLTLLNMLTAHIAKLNYGTNGEAASDLVGRISNAAEGSVSVATAFIDPKTELAAWANQTKYGANWWAATASYRTARYVGSGGRYGRGLYGG